MNFSNFFKGKGKRDSIFQEGSDARLGYLVMMAILGSLIGGGSEEATATLI